MKFSLVVAAISILIFVDGTNTKEHKFISIEANQGTYRFQYGQFNKLAGKIFVDLYQFDEIKFDHYEGGQLQGDLIQLKSRDGNMVEFLFTNHSAFQAVEQKIQTVEE